MTAERRQRVLELLDATLAEPPGSRPAFLDQACGEDVELRRNVESLLELESAAEGFLPEPAVPLRAEEPTLEKGIRIGPYSIVEELGRGGMGTVYRAVRQDDFEKQVALKLLQRDLVNEATVRRFHNERQILAKLEHPLIAGLLDGGTTADGRPYLVMEYVEGVPIDEYCDVLGLPTRKRLGLFLKVCSALAFAHQSLVVHRDLKPGNILITDQGVPKLLDFGIAKLLDTDDTLRLELTQGAEQPMTPRYASPEQVCRQPITTASDIYGLGNLLFRLLTGRLPCGLESCRFAEVAWRIVEEEPVRPSVTIGRDENVSTTEGERHWTPESVSRTRDGDPDKLRRNLAGDVDAILLKALRKEPQKRYASVEQLSEDIRRHLAGLPVAARKGTLFYRGTKYLKRHRWRMVAGLIALLAVAGFILREQQRLETESQRERQRLESERQRAEQVIRVLRDLINLADPDRRDDAFVIQTLEDVRDRLADLKSEPELRSELLATLGRIHLKLGHTEEAWKLTEESLKLWQQQNPHDLSGLAARHNNLGAIANRFGDFGRAEEHLREAVALREQLGEESPDFVDNLHNLASILSERGTYDEAESLYRRVIDIREGSLGRDAPSMADSLMGLGSLLHTRGDFDIAEPLVSEALEIRRQAYGDQDTRVARVIDLLGSVRFGLGDLRAAEAHYREAIEIQQKRLSPEHYRLAWSERNLASLMLVRGNLEASRTLLTRARTNLAIALPEGHWRIVATDSIFGALLTAEGKYTEAESLLLESHHQLRELRGEQAIHTRDAQRWIVDLYKAWGRPEKAAPFQALKKPKLAI
ncbi:MAG: serine/threonine-protein kinase [Acidobacteriota bacterium]